MRILITNKGVKEMKLKDKKILISLAILVTIGFIVVKALGFQFAGPAEFAIFSIEE